MNGLFCRGPDGAGTSVVLDLYSRLQSMSSADSVTVDVNEKEAVSLSGYADFFHIGAGVRASAIAKAAEGLAQSGY